MNAFDRSAATASDTPDEPARTEALRRTGLLDGGPDPAFDRLTRLLARQLSVPTTMISVFDGDRQLVLSHHGLPEPWAERRTTPEGAGFCRAVVDRREPLYVADARSEPEFLRDPATATLGVVAYAGMPIAVRDGQVVGALCAVDTQPREWTDDDLATLADLAALAESEVALRCELAERKAAEERLGLAVAEIDHRVKNSLTVTRSLLEMQARAADDESVRAQLEEAAARVSTIAHVHDRLYRSEATGAVALADYLDGLCDDLGRALGIAPERREISIARTGFVVPADRAVSLGLVVTQLVTHAAKLGPGGIRVTFAEGPDAHFTLTIADAGRPDPDDAPARRGIGMRLVGVLTKQLGGETETDADGTIRIELPAAALA
ncbi:MAG: sensor histidine kinase [Alphaproteobacteria bacterium]